MATEKKLVKSKSGLRMISSQEDELSPLYLTEPPWMPDNECSTCIECKAKFDFMKRRHHCRRCGQCYCGSCCSHKVSLPRMCFVDPVRVCGNCALLTKKEADFFEKHIKTLANGGHFQVSEPENNNDNGPVLMCKLSQNHRFLCFESSEAEIDPIDLNRIISIRIITSDMETTGTSVGTGLVLTYSTENDERQSVTMNVAPPPNRKPAMVWLAAMHKASKLIAETRAAE